MADFSLAIKGPRVVGLLLASFFLTGGCAPSAPDLEFTSSRVLPAGTRSFAVAPNGTALVVGAVGDVSRCPSSLVLGLDPRSLYFTGSMTRVSQWVGPIKFVSPEYGFVYGCWIDPETAAREEWPMESARLERLQLDGTRSVVSETIDAPISSLSVSANRRLLVTSSSGPIASQEKGECNIYSLDDGALLSSFSPTDVWQPTAVFVGNSERCLVVSRQRDASVRGYLVEATTGMIVHEAEIHDSGMEIYDLVASPDAGEIYIAFNSEVGRFTIHDDQFKYERLNVASALKSNISPRWLAYDSDRGLLAIGEEIRGVPSGNATSIFSTRTLNRLAPVLQVSGPMSFALDQKTGEKRLFMTPSLADPEQAVFGDLRMYFYVGQLRG
jgi:hypothetical protein